MISILVTLIVIGVVLYLKQDLQDWIETRGKS